MREIQDFDSVMIKLASPDQIKAWSYGEVKKPETINYRTLRPERDGLFCEKIFGTTKEWECYCGKFKSIRYKGVVCDRCGVEVTNVKVRRERMGHITLATPVSHIWYYRSVPSRMGYLLDLSKEQLSSVLYYEKYIVTNPGESELKKMQLLTEEEYLDARNEWGETFEAGMGGEAIRNLLATLDLDELSKELREQMKDKIKKGEKADNYKKLRKRIEIVESFRNNDKDNPNRPEWMILTVIPVIPPDLRPMVQLDGGRFATSDLNDLYRRVINRNNRLQKLMLLHAPDIIIRNEKRMLQEAVDALFDNSKRKRGAVKGANSRPLKSLSDMLKGKQGRFRQNLLGKRVDYSGRSVIVVGPELRIHQCGVPSKMALELFKPFLMRRLVQSGVANNIKIAKIMVEQEKPEVWDILEQVVKEHPVMLNRAPTLHRLGIQAFEPVLVDGKAIKLHPLVCKAFNADFDGDQMAIHVPLTQAAQLECWTLMLSATNLLDPANGQPIVYPSQDMVLGINYLTRAMNNAKGEGKYYDNLNEIFMAIDAGVLSYNAKIGYTLPDGTRYTFPKDQEDYTTPGRLIFADALPCEAAHIDFRKSLNKCFGDKDLKKLIAASMKVSPNSVVCKLADAIKDVGYKYATVFGATIGLSDMIVPEAKAPLMAEANRKQAEILTRFEKGLITNEERKNLLINLWSDRSDKLGDELMARLRESQNGFNPLFLMADSGARGSKTQIKQLGGMRGLMAKPNGDIIEFPIKSNFKEGLSIIEFFISTNGARKGLSDTALKTAEAGYLTRRLVDVSQDVVITQEDCGTINGIERTAVMNGEDVVIPLADRIRGHYTLEDVLDPNTGDVLVPIDHEISDEEAVMIEEAGVEKVLVRSVLTCEAKRGLCRKCYGRNLATNRPVEIGEPVGVIAAQSIGQPGTQLTMRTFHVGGTASTSTAADSLSLKHSVFISRISGNYVKRNSDGELVFTKKGFISYRPLMDDFKLSEGAELAADIADSIRVKGNTLLFTDAEGCKHFANQHGGQVMITKNRLVVLGPEKKTEEIKAGSCLKVSEGQFAESGDVLVTFDPFAEPIVCEKEGLIRFRDLEEGRALVIEKNQSEEGVVEIYKVVDAQHLSTIIGKDREYGAKEGVKHEHSDSSSPCSPTIEILDENDNVIASYRIPASSIIKVRDDGSMAECGQVLAERPKAGTKSQDITGGLPRVGELFEASKPKNPAVLAKVSGIVEFGSVEKAKQIINIRDQFGKIHEHRIEIVKNIIVRDGDEVEAAEPLTDGNVNLHDILEICGEHKLQQFLLEEVQSVYRQQGVDINDKHLGIIVRQMLRKVRVIRVGDTHFIIGQEIDKTHFQEENARVIAEGGQPATAMPLLQGIKQASLSIGSFISAASFLETTKVLTNAAIVGSRDELQGLKENVIIGHLIPAGTGMKCYRDIKLPEESDLTLGERVAAVKDARQREMEDLDEMMGAEEIEEPEESAVDDFADDEE